MTTAINDGATHESDVGTHARRALEEVCSGRHFERVADFYGDEFVDHVNDMTFTGLAGAQQSVSFYRSAFPDLSVDVEDQVVQGESVASRWIMRGTYRGREASMRGITISHVARGRIVEDWTYSDTVGLLRQLGLWRAVLVGLRWTTHGHHWRRPR